MTNKKKLVVLKFCLMERAAARYLVIFFVIIQILLPQNGGLNASSRLAFLAALSHDQSFKINPYVDWTIDWAQTPDGNYYSNKAPGPAFFALPIFILIDKTLNHGLTPENRIERLRSALWIISYVLSICLQIIPFAFLALFLWQKSFFGESTASLWILVTFLFGHTASIFMNTFFGHGLAALMAILMYYSLKNKAWVFSSLFYGMLLLSDYGAATLIPALLYYLYTESAFSLKRDAWKIIAGAIAPAILWIAYHNASFGSPFSLPNKFQNPIFKDLIRHDSNSLWGVLSFYPNIEAVGGLIFGLKRGLIWTQPWLLYLIFILLFKWRSLTRDAKRDFNFILLGFMGLFTMNASFGGWHGGGSSGPRYLSMWIPLFVFLIPKIQLSFTMKFLMIWSYMMSALILSTTILAPQDQNLFNVLWVAFNKTSLLRLSIVFIGTLIFIFKYKNLYQNRHS